MRTIPALVVLSLVLLALLSGCESTTTAPADPIGGWIEGYVIDGGEGGLGGRPIVVAHRPWGSGEWMHLELETDADGYYCVGLPDGEAVLRTHGYETMFYTHQGPTYDIDEADTIRVDGGVTRADFLCGRLLLVADEDPVDMDFWQDAQIIIPPLAGSDWFWIRSLFGDGFGVFGGGDQWAASFRFVLPGQYAIRSEPAGLLTGYFLPGSFRGDDAELYSVAPMEVTTVMAVRPEPAILHGRIEGSWEEFGLAPWFRVTIADSWTVDYFVCDADGRFEVELPAGGDFELNFFMDDTTQHDHPSLDHWGTSYNTIEAEVYTVANGGISEEILIQVGGLELDLQGDPDMTRARIEVFGADGVPIVNGGHWDTSPFPARIGNVLPGTYTLQITTNGAAVPCYQDGSLSLDEAGTVDVVAGEITHVTVPLTVGGRISGRILATDGEPLPSCFYLAYHQVDSRFDPCEEFWSCGLGESMQMVYDDTTGEFEIRGVAPGDYKLRLRVEGADQWLWYSDAYTWDDATPVTVPEGGDAAWFQWTVNQPAP